MLLILTSEEHPPHILLAWLLSLHLPFCFLELPVHFLRVLELTIHRRCTLQLVADLHHDQSLLICPHITGNFQKELFFRKR